MKSEQESKPERKSKRISLGCLVSIGVMLGCALMLFMAELRYGASLLIRNDQLRLVMDTYYFGDGLAELTGDTSILETVVTEAILQRQIEYCNKGFCDGSYLPHVIGEYFKVLRETDEFAVVELNDRPLLPDAHRGYLRWCYSLVRDGDDWRVSGMYLDCDGYLPDKYK